MSVILRTAVTTVFAVLLATAIAQELDLSEVIDGMSQNEAKADIDDLFADEDIDDGDVVGDDVGDSGESGTFADDLIGDVVDPAARPATEDDAANDVDSLNIRDIAPPDETRDEPPTPEQVPKAKANVQGNLHKPNEPTKSERPQKPLPGVNRLPLTPIPDQAFGTFVRSRTVVLDASNGIDGAIGTLDRSLGTLNPTTALNVELFNAASQRIRSVNTDGNGRFRFDNLTGGMYQLVAKGHNGFLAFSLMVIERRSAPNNGLGAAEQPPEQLFLVQTPMNTQESIDVVSAAVPPTFQQVNSILKLHYGLSVPTYMLPGGSSPDVVNSDANRPTAKMLDRDSPIAKAAVRMYEVPLLDGNRIKGRMYSFDPKTGVPISVTKIYVHIIRDDRPIGPPISVNTRGEFEAELPDGAGAYSIIAAGEGGFGAAGFFARSKDELDAKYKRQREYFVSTELKDTELAQADLVDPLIDQIPAPLKPLGNIAPDGTLSLPVICNDVLTGPQIANNDSVIVEELVAVEPMAEEVDFAGPPMPIGFSPPPGGGGFGGGSVGGRGFGALLLGGGIVAAIAISADDNRPPASPFFP